MPAPEDTPGPPVDPQSDTPEACSTVVVLKSLPKHLGRLFLEGNDVLKPLREAHPWLNVVDGDEGADISKLQIKFYEDSFTFMKILLEFLHAKKWQEFIYSTCESEQRYGPVLLLLLHHVFVENANTSSEPASAGKDRHDNQVFLEKLLPDSESLKGFFKEFESRSRRIRVDNNKYGFYSEQVVLEKISKKLDRDIKELSGDLEVAELWISKVNSMNEETMAFGYGVAGLSTDGPRGLSESVYWKRVGENLCSLGLLVGADVPREPDEKKPKPIVAALRAAADNQGRATKVMLARLEEQSVTIRKQQQAITALQYRRVLEMVPSKGSAPAYGEATSQWKDFWDGALNNAYNAYAQDPATSSSPLSNLTKNQFDKAKSLKQSKQIKWLKQTDTNQQARLLYGTLSKVIHEYAPDEFSVDCLSFSPGIEELLKAIRPKNVVDGAVDWKAENQRYSV